MTISVALLTRLLDSAAGAVSPDNGFARESWPATLRMLHLRDRMYACSAVARKTFMDRVDSFSTVRNFGQRTSALARF